jgi:hypothetical protein
MKLISLLLSSLVSSVVADHVSVYSAELSGQAEVPPVDTDVTGSVTLMSREGSTGMIFNLQINNPSQVPLLGAAGAHVSTDSSVREEKKMLSHHPPYLIFCSCLL